MILIHSHSPSSNPFSLAEHRRREPGREEVEQRARELRKQNVPFRRTRRLLVAKIRAEGANLSKKYFYNIYQQLAEPLGRKEDFTRDAKAFFTIFDNAQ